MRCDAPTSRASRWREAIPNLAVTKCCVAGKFFKFATKRPTKMRQAPLTFCCPLFNYFMRLFTCTHIHTKATRTYARTHVDDMLFPVRLCPSVYASPQKLQFNVSVRCAEQLYLSNRRAVNLAEVPRRRKAAAVVLVEVRQKVECPRGN